MVFALRQFISRSQPLPRQACRNRITLARFYSQGPTPSGGRLRLDRRTTTYLAATAGLVLGGYYVTHLENAPETGRRRFMAVSEQHEEYIRKQILEQTLEEFRGKILPFNHPMTQLVRRITRRIITSSNLGHLKGDSGSKWEQMWDSLGSRSPVPEIPRPQTLHPDKEWIVLVIHDRNLVNAFAAPGLVCVSTGIIPMARDEEGLAAIIGHEIGHVAMRHTEEHLSQAFLWVPIAALFVVWGLGPVVFTILSNYLYFLPHSRVLETEADIVGMKLMSRACYNPAAAPRVFEGLQKLETGHVPKFLSTHPPTPERIAKLKTLLPENYNTYISNPECSQLDAMRWNRLLAAVWSIFDDWAE
ncbi:peptidase M48 family protein [Mycena latifolia]|nr:peptidase M48 family protein [Mycena latifolia]